MKTLMLSIALISFTFMSCDKSEVPTEPQTSSNALLKATQFKDFPLTVTFFNECCNEFVKLSGTAHFVLRDNGRHFNVTDITGVGGSTGETYTGHNTAVHNESGNFGNGASNGSTVLHVHMTNENGCSFSLRIHIHFTVNANGEVTVQILSIGTKCD